MKNFESCIINVIPIKVNQNFEEDITSWKSNKSTIPSSNVPSKETQLQHLPSNIGEDQFIRIYQDLPILKTYFLGRKFYGEQVPINERYQIHLFESTKVIDHSNMKDQQVLKKISNQQHQDVDNINNKLIVWEHEKLASDSNSIDGNFQNQWYDINEMIKVNEIIHE